MTADVRIPDNSGDLRDLRRAFVSRGRDMRLVGGFVRCLLSGREPADVDLHVDAFPDEMAATFVASGTRHHATGLAHGTYTVVLQSGVYEITSLRSAGGGGRAGPRHTRDW